MKAELQVYVGYTKKKVAIKSHKTVWSETAQSKVARHQRSTQQQAARSRKDVTQEVLDLTNKIEYTTASFLGLQ